MNYITRLRAWHILHSQPWHFNEDQLRSTLAGAAKLAPASSKKPKWEPFTINTLECVLEKLDCSKPLDATITGCTTTIFYSLLCTTEFTQKTLNSFNPADHIKPSDISQKINQNSLSVTVFTLPKTKCSDEPKDTYRSRQDGISNPEHNLQNHLTVNTPPPDGPLLAYKCTKGHRPLIRKVFLD